jgi:hypothetical protein
MIFEKNVRIASTCFSVLRCQIKCLNKKDPEEPYILGTDKEHSYLCMIMGMERPNLSIPLV